MSRFKAGSKEAKEYMASIRNKKGAKKSVKKSVLVRRQATKAAAREESVKKTAKKKTRRAATRKAAFVTVAEVAPKKKRAKKAKASGVRGRAYGYHQPNPRDESELLSYLGIKKKPSEVMWACGGRVRSGCGKGRVLDRVYS